MTTQETFLSEAITITNILTKTPMEITQFVNSAILNNMLPEYTPNNSVSVNHDLMPRLSKYANDKAYITELFNIVVSELFQQKKYKRVKDTDNRDEEYYTDLEAKHEILYRTSQALDRFYEAASRMMTGIGSPDPRQNRHQ